ncbi:MAG: zf-HC2 domain-containing protein, partial [Methanomicrobiales archaeon]|nr:zf-HC2 domain-containing protein [Methanomicrobiales archaeon]
MNCTRIEPELSAYLDDELQGAQRHRVEQHLAHCDACRVKLARMRRTAAMVAGIPAVAPPADLAARVFARVAPESMPAMVCAEAVDKVHAYADGWLAPAEVARLEAHLRDCPECEAELRRVRALKRVASGIPEVAPPPSVRATVAAAIAARQARSRRTLRPWVWGPIGAGAAAAAVWLLTLIGPGPAPVTRTAAPRLPLGPPAPVVAGVTLPAPAA